MLAGVELDGLLGDAVFVATTVAFFAVSWLLVWLCERIAGEAEVTVDHGMQAVDAEIVEVAS